MRFVFWVAEKSAEQQFAEALRTGAKVHGDEIELWTKPHYVTFPHDEFDGAAALGISTHSLHVMQDCERAGRRFLYFDKGYMRRDIYKRVSIDGFSPGEYLYARKYPMDRFAGLHLKPERWVRQDKFILYVGSSQKYCFFHGLGDANDYAESVFRKLEEHTRKPLRYRPKPSWLRNHPDQFRKIKGIKLVSMKKDFVAILNGCALVVTHGSNAAFDALLNGVPIMVLGNHIAQMCGLGPDGWLRINEPVFPSDDTRLELFARAAYCQWRGEEYLSGEAWATIREQLSYDPDARTRKGDLQGREGHQGPHRGSAGSVQGLATGN